jgi:hypothetical protein
MLSKVPAVPRPEHDAESFAVCCWLLQVQRAIYDHQNPADCSKAKFLIHSTIPSGVASIMNVETVSLLAALDR